MRKFGLNLKRFKKFQILTRMLKKFIYGQISMLSSRFYKFKKKTGNTQSFILIKVTNKIETIQNFGGWRMKDESSNLFKCHLKFKNLKIVALIINKVVHITETH